MAIAALTSVGTEARGVAFEAAPPERRRYCCFAWLSRVWFLSGFPPCVWPCS